MASARVAVVGDFRERSETHRLTNEVLAQAGLATEWIATDAIADAERQLAGFDGVWVAPGSPYASMDGAIEAVRFARERGVPLGGACGGFQHAVLEFARDVAGIADADHAETSPDAARPVIDALECSLAGLEQTVRLVPGTLAAEVYGVPESVEAFYCSYGVNPEYEATLEEHGLRFSGVDEEGRPRLAELPNHPHFLVSLFVPRPGADGPHPLAAAFARAASRPAVR